MGSFYRAIKDNPMWKAGAIVELNEDRDQYDVISGVWDIHMNNQDTTLADRRNVENNPEWFEKVYENEKSSPEKPIFETEDQHLSKISKRFTPKYSSFQDPKTDDRV